LSEDLGVSDRSVRTFTRELEEMGLVRVEQPGLGRSNRYVLYRPDEIPDRKQASGLTGSTFPGIEEDSVEEDSVPPISPAGEKDIETVFSHWQVTMGKGPGTRLTPKRRKKIVARLSEGTTVDEMIRAIDGCAGSDFHMGRELGKPDKHNDLELILRSRDKVEWFMEKAEPDSDDDYFAGTEFGS
jgi:hypothetical protein